MPAGEEHEMSVKVSMPIPMAFRDLLDRPLLACLATVRPDGTPQVSPMWFRWDGDTLQFSSTTKRQKHANILRKRDVAAVIADPAALRHIELRGPIESIVPDVDGAFWLSLASRYGDDAHGPPPDVHDRVTYHLRPIRIATFARRPDWPATARPAPRGA
jgi:PPOX class probable F420-dependent enzyme